MTSAGRSISSMIQDIKASCLPTLPFREAHIRHHISQIMRLSLILAVVAAFKLAVSMPVVSDDGDCPVYCNVGDCCPSDDCQPIQLDPYDVSMSSFHQIPWL